MPENLRIIYKNVKNANLKVKQNLDVILTVPTRTRQATIDMIIARRKEWISRQLEYFKQRQVQPKTYTSDEEFQFLGQTYPLKVIESAGKNEVILVNGFLHLGLSKSTASSETKSKLIDQWYKVQAWQHFLPILERYANLIHKAVNRVVIRKMKTRWGSCNPKKAYINLNLELIKKPIAAIEYVILHELAHLTHYGHDRNFYNYMSLYMPDWKDRKKLLS